MKDWPGQIVLCTSQMYWTSEVHDALRDGTKGLRVSTTFYMSSTHDVLSASTTDH